MTEQNQNSLQDETPSEEKLNCTIKIEDSGVWKKKIGIEVSREEIDKRLNLKYNDLLKTAEVPGFRRGRAPRRLVEKRFGEDIADQTKLMLLAEAFDQVDKEQKFEVLGEPDFDPDKVELPETGNFVFEYEVEVRPQFELPKLEGIRIEKPMFEVTDARVNEAITELLNRNGTNEEIADGAQAEDMVMCDATLKIEGVEEPLTQQGYPVKVGPAAVLGVWFEDMAKTLKGAKADDTKTVSTTIPADHHEEAWQGKQAEATLVVKGVRRRVPATLNADLFAKLGVGSEAELRSLMEENLGSHADREVRKVMQQQVYDYLDKSVVFELPKGITERYAGRVFARRYYDLMMNGASQEIISEHMEELKARSTEQATKELKTSFIMDMVAEKLEIKVGDAEVNNTIAQMAMMYRRRPERLRDEMQKEGRLEDLKTRIRDERAIDKVLESAEVVDAPEPKAKEIAEEKPVKKAPAKKAAKAKEEPVVEAAPAAEESADDKAAKKAVASRKEVKRKPPSADKE